MNGSKILGVRGGTVCLMAGRWVRGEGEGRYGEREEMGHEEEGRRGCDKERPRGENRRRRLRGEERRLRGKKGDSRKRGERREREKRGEVVIKRDLGKGRGEEVDG